MAIVFVDYENVCGLNGLDGAEYLTENDELRIFYSSVCRNISRQDCLKIENSGCSFRICELAKSRKNALDFYIATAVGIAIEAGERFIVIVSRDEGLKAVRDYLISMRYSIQVIISPTIANGLMKLNGPANCERKKAIEEEHGTISLPEEYAHYIRLRSMKVAI